MSPDRPWVVVSGAGGALGSVLAAHYANKGLPVLALDRQIERLAAGKAPEAVVAREADLCSEPAIKAALDEVLGATGRVRLLVNAVGEIWNEPVLSLRANKITAHSLDNWRRV